MDEDTPNQRKGSFDDEIEAAFVSDNEEDDFPANKSSDNSVRRIMYTILTQAVKDCASDIYILSEKTWINIYNKIDGELVSQFPLPKYIHKPLGTELKTQFGAFHHYRDKVKIELESWEKEGFFRRHFPRKKVRDIYTPVVGVSLDDILETELRFSEKIDDEKKLKSYYGLSSMDDRFVRFNMSILPVESGESYHIEVFDLMPKVDNIQLLELFDNMPHSGLVLIASPADNGKTTTASQLFQRSTRGIENPLILNNKLGYNISFPRIKANPQSRSYQNTLEQIKRFNPSVIMMDEINDELAAKTAVYLAANGALVIGTVPCYDATSGVRRLLELSVDSDALADNLRCVIGKRLVRTYEKVEPSEGAKKEREALLASFKRDDLREEDVIIPQLVDITKQYGTTPIYQFITKTKGLDELTDILARRDNKSLREYIPVTKFYDMVKELHTAGKVEDKELAKFKGY